MLKIQKPLLRVLVFYVCVSVSMRGIFIFFMEIAYKYYKYKKKVLIYFCVEILKRHLRETNEILKLSNTFFFLLNFFFSSL